MLTTKGKTEYRFTIQNTQDAEQKIQSWLSANSFQQVQEDGVVYYRGGDAMLGYRFFEYSINGSQLVLYAYLGSFKKPKALADGLAGSMAIIPYKNALEPLIAALNNNTTEADSITSAQQIPVYEQPQRAVQQQNTYGEFKQATNKRNNTCAEISFWISLLMLLASFTGIIAGAIIVIFNYYLAVQGLKSDKKGKAIAAIIMSSISIIIIIVKLIIEISK